MFARKSKDKSSQSNTISSIRGFFSSHFSRRARSDRSIDDSVKEMMSRYHLDNAVATKELDGLGPLDAALLVECYGKGLRGSNIRTVRHMREDSTDLLCALLHTEDALNRYFTTLLKETLLQSQDATTALLSALDACAMLDRGDLDRIVFLHKHMCEGVRNEHLQKLAMLEPDSASQIDILAAQYLDQTEGLSPVEAFTLLDPANPEYARALLYLTTKENMSIGLAQQQLVDKSREQLSELIPKVSVPSPN